jgi:lipopolysaccharide transport system ATP-binding protein
MKRHEIDRKFEEIVEFAEVGKFIDTPLKRYSTGMQVRLAFSVAAHLEQEIFMVDEVLAVGDVEFQKKCLGKMESVTKRGRTVLFISHNMGMISTLCEKAILLDKGHVELVGPSQQVVSTYLARFSSDVGPKKEWSFEEAPGGDVAKLKAIRITNRQGIEQLYFSCTEPIYVTVDYWVLCDDSPMYIALRIFDEKENFICTVCNFTEIKKKPITKRGLYRSRCTIPGNLLNSGRHTLTVEMLRSLIESEAMIHHCAAFETVDDHSALTFYKWGGIIKPDFEWHTENISDDELMKFSA